jgi:mannose-6-phosphate isomerase-like protein (cupin superfamily)
MVIRLSAVWYASNIHRDRLLTPFALFTVSWLSACASSAPPPPAEPASAPPPPAEPAGPSASPVPEALPMFTPPSLPQRATCRYGTCLFSRMIPYELTKDLAERGELLIWEELISSKAKVAIPADGAVDLAGMVLEGDIALSAVEAPKVEPMKLAQWGGFHAPGGGLLIAPSGGKAARLVLVAAVGEAEGTLAKHVERYGKSKKPYDWKERKTPITFVDFSALSPITWGKGAYHARVGWDARAAAGAAGEGGAKDTGGDPAGEGRGEGAKDEGAAPALSMSLLLYSKDAADKAHVHEKARECLVFLQGAGDVVLISAGATENAPPEERHLSVQPGMTVCFARGLHHAWQPAGTEALLALQVFTPPGPEQVFKKLAASAAKKR